MTDDQGPSPGFVPYHRTIVASQGVASQGKPASWMLVLHGIYGRGDNWRTFARDLVARRPDWGAVLVDLRAHGRSTHAPPPHRVDTAAADLMTLERALARDGCHVRAVCGHSFGGKVALAYSAARAHAPDPGPGPFQTFIIDASPSPRPAAMDDADNTVVRVLRALARHRGPFASRADFVRAMGDEGFAPALGQWLAMNLERDDTGYRLGLDPDALEHLLRDYYQLDAWPMVEHIVDNDGGHGHAAALVVVIAGRSDVLDAADRARFSGLAASGADLWVATIEDAGHWVHIDAPEALLDTVSARLPR